MSVALQENSCLSSLKPGESGVIEAVDTNEEVCLKLFEMGLAPGEAVRMIRKAPFGGPLILEIMSYRLAIRRTEADQIRLKAPALN